jgi:hypothetical protein
MPTKKKTPERYVDILKISKRYLVLLGIAELSTGPFQEAVTPKNIIAGFNATEIFPLQSICDRSFQIFTIIFNR